MNGVQPFVYVASCGCVFSLAGLKTVSSVSSTPTPPHSDKGKEQEQVDGVGKEFEVCPQCATKYDKAGDVIPLNPSLEEEERLFVEMERRRLLEPAKKSKKRKAAIDDNAAQPTKKRPPHTMPSTNPGIAAASRAVVSSLAMEEAKRKAEMSEAVKSLYTNEDAPKRKETFMTMGTFTRVCDLNLLAEYLLTIAGFSVRLDFIRCIIKRDSRTACHALLRMRMDKRLLQ